MFNFRKKKEHSPTALYAPAHGNLMLMEEVKDPVFSQKIMGDGYAVYPVKGSITSPVAGTIITIFPTKHAIGILTNNDEEVILHMGINTVELAGIPFSMCVKEGDLVNAGQPLTEINLAYLQEQQIDPTIIVVFTKKAGDSILDLQAPGEVANGQQIGAIKAIAAS